jgi:HPt (histidine-containing phosphotransfer) domain-containing protein
MLGALENGFHEVRQALEEACPAGLPISIPAVSAAFMEQIAPEREGPARALADRLVASFGADAPSRILDLREAVGRGDAEAAQRIAQTLKGMCGLVGAEPLAKLAALVEADARLKRVGQAERYLEHLDIELERVQAILKR